MSILKNPIALSIFNSLKNFILNSTPPKFNPSNTATGAISVTLNTTSGVAVFTDTCGEAPIWVDYSILNSLITASSLVNINVQASDSFGFVSKVSYYCGAGFIVIAINDGFTSAPAAPIVTFQILNP